VDEQRTPRRAIPAEGADAAHAPIPSASSTPTDQNPELGATAMGVLGVLNLSDGFSGYDIKQIADRSLRFFFPLGYGQIYPSLQRLTDAGLAEPVAGEPDGPRNRRAYRITDAGRAALRAWLHRDTEPNHMRSEFAAKLLLAAPLDPERAMAMVEEYRDWVAHRLEVIRFNREAVPQRPPNLEAAISWGEVMTEANLAWCDTALELLAQLPEPS
jgi:PadR family transcriptional regulator, regulatory protein AphA